MADEKKPPIERDFQIDILYFVAAMFAVLPIRDLLVGGHVETIPYSDFRVLIDKGEAKDLEVGSTRITRTYTTSSRIGLLIDVALQAARGILQRNRPILDTSARELLARETLGPDDLVRLTAGPERDIAKKRPVAAV